MRSTRSSRTTVTLHELPAPIPPHAPDRALPEHVQVVFVTHAVRRRSTLHTRDEDQRRPVLAAVVR